MMEYRNLIRFEEAPKSTWTDKLRVAFCKCKYLHAHVEAMKRDGETMEEATRRCDVEKGTRTMAQYLDILKGNDESTRKRRRGRLD